MVTYYYFIKDKTFKSILLQIMAIFIVLGIKDKIKTKLIAEI